MAESRTVPAKMREIKPPTQDDINKYLTDQKITDTHQGIAKRVNEGKFQQSTNISKMDTKVSIPVVLRILFHIQKTLNDGLDQSEHQDLVKQTLGIVQGAICMFHETVETLNMGAWKKLSYLRALDASQTIMELEYLVADIQKITITPATEKLWDEVALWMDGIYRRTADKIKKGPKPCHLVSSSMMPAAENLADIDVKKSHAAYVRSGEALFYIDKELHVFNEIKLSHEKLKQFDQIAVGNRAYTDNELQRITKITGHKHPETIVPLRGVDGSFPRVDVFEDDVLYKATNNKLTKMEISLYYHQAASTITNLLEQFKMKKASVPVKPVIKPIATPVAKPVVVPVAKPVVPPIVKPVVEPVAEVKVAEPVPEAKVAEPVVEVKVVEPVAEVKVAEPVVAVKAAEPVVELKVDEPVAEVKIVELEVPSVVEAEDVLQASEYIENFPSVTENDVSVFYTVEVARRYDAYLQEICNVVNDMLSNPLVEELKKDINSSDQQARLYNFQSALRVHHLSPSQKKSLSNFREDAIAAITHYTNERKRWHNYLFKTHHVDALNAINTLKATEDTEDHLNVMLRLYREMYSQSSEGLFKDVSEVLMTALERLCPKNLDHHITGKTSIQSENEDSMTLCIEVPKGQEAFLQQIIDLVNEMLDNPLLALLKKDVSSPDERLRLSNFQSALTRFNLNYDQKGMLANFRDDAISVLKKYMYAKDTWRSMFFNKAHADKAGEMIQTLEGASDDPREHLMAMFGLHREMFGQTSVGLFKNINELLLRTLERLCPRPQEADLRLSAGAVKPAQTNSQESDVLPLKYGLKK